MPGQQLTNAWIGNRSELLATYVLSNIAAVTHVRREDDYGLDLLCTLISRQGNVLRAGRAFGVQVKSSAERGISYGGLDRHGNWKCHEIEWLFGQDQPILIAVADIQKWGVRLYSTQRIWYLRFQIGLNPGEIVLMPNEDLPPVPIQPAPIQQVDPWSHYHRKPLDLTIDRTPAGDGFSYLVPLGKPIVEIDYNEEDERLSRIQEVLGKWVDVDYDNIRNKNTGVAYIREWSRWEPNNMPDRQQVWSFYNPTPGWNVGGLLETVAPAIQCLMLDLEAQGQIDAVKAVLPLAQLIRDNNLFDAIGLCVLKRLESRT